MPASDRSHRARCARSGPTVSSTREGTPSESSTIWSPDFNSGRLEYALSHLRGSEGSRISLATSHAPADCLRSCRLTDRGSSCEPAGRQRDHPEGRRQTVTEFRYAWAGIGSFKRLLGLAAYRCTAIADLIRSKSMGCVRSPEVSIRIGHVRRVTAPENICGALMRLRLLGRDWSNTV